MHGVLHCHEWAREMARSLLKCGNEVHVISAVENEDESRKWIGSLCIPFTEVHCVRAINHEDAGVKKAEVMKKVGCEVLLDDVPPIIIEVRKQGFIGLHVQ